VISTKARGQGGSRYDLLQGGPQPVKGRDPAKAFPLRKETGEFRPGGEKPHERGRRANFTHTLVLEHLGDL